MRIAQPQWEGWGDDRRLAAEAGLPVPDRHRDGQSTLSFADEPCISPWWWYAVLSVRSATGLWVGNAPVELEGHLARGPAILDARACAEVPLLDLRRADDLPAEGLHVDVTARTVDLYVRPQLRSCYDLDLEDVRAAWAGWTVRDHTRDIAAHPEATPHRAWCEGRIRFPEPNHRRALGDALHSARRVLRWAWQRDPSSARSMQAIFDRALHSEP